MERYAILTEHSQLLRDTSASEAVGTVTGGIVHLAGGQDVALGADLVRVLNVLLEAGLSNRRAQIVVSPEYVTPQEAATLLGVSRPTIYKWQESGTLSMHMVGSHRRIPREDVDSLLLARQYRANVDEILSDQSLDTPMSDDAYRKAMFTARRTGGVEAVAQLRRAQEAALARHAAARARGASA